MDDDLIGQHLGQYEIVARLGEGGMATVYRAHQASIRRDVAIKVIVPHLAQMETFVKRFEREAQTVASLSHPHIVKVFDYGQRSDLVYIVMELLSGGSLANLIAREGSLPLDVTARLLDQIAPALDYAHELGIVHRDLKPQNVLLDTRGNAFLTDFGIAKIITESSTLTQTGSSVGTPAYMSPEQWQSGRIDGRADVYSLGVMLFEMLSGTLPFLGETPFVIMHKHVYEEPPSIQFYVPSLPAQVQEVIIKALAKDPEQRWSSAQLMADAFRTALAGQAPMVTPAAAPPVPPSGSPPTGVPSPTWQPPHPAEPSEVMEMSPKRGLSPLLLGLGVGFVIVIIALIGALIVASQNKATPTAAVVVPSVVPSNSPVATTAIATITANTAKPTVVAPSATSTLTPSMTSTLTSTSTPTIRPTETQTTQPTATSTTAIPTATENSGPLPVYPGTPTSGALTIITATRPLDTSARIAFTSGRKNASGEIYVMDADGSHVVEITNTGAHNWRAAWSPDNKQIVFQSDIEGHYEIGVIDVDGNNPHRLTTSDPGESRYPSWSPDGKQIAFASTRDGHWQIYVTNADGSNPHNLSNNGAQERYPGWSPDGKQITFTSTRDVSQQIYVMNADGSNAHRLTQGPADNYLPAWSPDGTFIVFDSQRDGTDQIYLMNADGGNPRRLTNNKNHDYLPSFSPDGQSICFYSDRDTIPEVYVMDVTGYNQHRLTPMDSDNYYPAWSH